MSEWISTRKRLPKCEWGAEVGNIAYYCKNSGYVLCGCFGRGGKWRDQYFRTWNDAHEGIDADDVSHWMPLPEPPEEDDEHAGL